MFAFVLSHTGTSIQLRQTLYSLRKALDQRDLQPIIALLTEQTIASSIATQTGWSHGSLTIHFVKNQDWGDALQRVLTQLDTDWICSLKETDMPQEDFQYILSQLACVIEAHPKIAGIRIHSPNHSLPILYAWHRLLLLKRGGWPSKNEWPFYEMLDEYIWSRLHPSEKEEIKLDQESFQNGRISVWQQERQKWVDQFLSHLHSFDPPSPPFVQEPLVSVILSVYNGQDTIPWAIQTVLTQTMPRFELIVINDGSTDRTEEKILSFSDPRIRLISRPINRGKVYNLNDALQLSQGEFLFELDADDWLGPKALEWAVQSFRSLPEEVSLLYGDRLFWHKNENGSLIPRHTQQGKPIPSLKHYLHDLFPVGPRVYRRKALNQVGGWPVDNYQEGRLYEDIRVMLRLLEYYPIHYAPGLHYHVRMREESVSNCNKQYFLKWKQWIQAYYIKRGLKNCTVKENPLT